MTFASAVVKAGSRGCYYWASGMAEGVPAPSVEVTDTTGAGDTFDASFLYGRLDGRMSLERASRFANAAAARSCQFVGGVGARSTFEDVIALMEG